MNKYWMNLLIALFAFCLIGCKDVGPEKHVIDDSGVEWGVEIEVLLKGGGAAKLVCPKFNGEPAGAHGRECYLRSYDNATSTAEPSGR